MFPHQSVIDCDTLEEWKEISSCISDYLLRVGDNLTPKMIIREAIYSPRSLIYLPRKVIIESLPDDGQIVSQGKHKQVQLLGDILRIAHATEECHG